MKFIAKILVALMGNAFGLWASAALIPGVILESMRFEAILTLAALLTVIHMFIKPVVKLALGPLIILTLGVGLIAVNALMLYLLDTFSGNLTIQSIFDLLAATLMVSVINLVVHVATK